MIHKYKFYFQDFDAAGKPVTPILHGVDGWKEYGVNFGRETNISNVVKSYTGDYIFIKEDAAYLKSMLLSYGPNRRIRFIVDKLSDAFTCSYNHEYVGFVDLSQLQWDSDTCTAPISEAGFFKALENKWSTEFPIEFDSVCRLDGAVFRETEKFSKPDTKYNSDTVRYNSGIGLFNLGASLEEQNEGKHLGFCQSCSITNYNCISSGDRFALADKIPITDRFMAIPPSVILKSVTLRYELDIIGCLRRYAGTSLGSLTAKCRLYYAIVDDSNFGTGIPETEHDGNVERGYKIPFSDFVEFDMKTNSPHYPGYRDLNYEAYRDDIKYVFNFDGDVSFGDVNGGTHGKSVFVAFSIQLDGDLHAIELLKDKSQFVGFDYPKYSVEVSYATQINSGRYVSCIKAADLFTSLIDRVNNGIYTVNVDTSDFDVVAINDLITSNAGMRGAFRIGNNFFTIGSVETSIEAFLKYVYVVYGFQFGVDFDLENEFYTVFLAHHDDFYHPDVIDSIDNYDEMQLSVIRDMLFSNISVGYDIDTGSVYDGLSEFNNKMVWLTPNSEIEGNGLDLSSPYNASSRQIETCVYDTYEDFSTRNDDMSNPCVMSSVKISDIDNTTIYAINGPNSGLHLTDVKFGDVIVANNNPRTNGGYLFDKFFWFKNDVYHFLVENQYVQTNIDPQSVYICLARNAVTHVWTIFVFPNGTSFSITIADVAYMMGHYFENYSFNPIVMCHEYELDKSIHIDAGSEYPSYEWNVKFSPKRILNAHIKELNSYFAFDSGKKLTLITCDANDGLDAGGIVEKSDVVIGNDRLFVPVSISLHAPAKDGLITKLERNRCGCFELEYNGNVCHAFLAKNPTAVAVNPAHSQASEFSLVASDFHQLL